LRFLSLSAELADHLAEFPQAGIGREYPNKLDHVLNGDEDLRSPRDLHPAFYGCYDWHSAVHGHWTLVRLLKGFSLAKEAEIRNLLGANLTASNIAQEVAYLHQPNRQSFERPYGWGWLLKLAQELESWHDPDGRAWADALRPLTEEIVKRFLAFLPKQTYPVRTGLHSNTAFALILALEYALAVGNDELAQTIKDRSRNYYEKDHDYPAHLEPSGADFLSPSLTEAMLMRSILPDFRYWFHRFLPDLPESLLTPAEVGDREDPQIGHLDGLNLSRAWCMRKIADSLAYDDPVATSLYDSARQHMEAALPHIASGNYNGEHWLATFAVLLSSDPTPNPGE